jgi:hypothetical protein
MGASSSAAAGHTPDVHCVNASGRDEVPTRSVITCRPNRYPPPCSESGVDCTQRTGRRFRYTRAAAQRCRYSRSSPREMIVFWISDVPSPMSRNGASRMSRSISYSLE